MQTDSIPVTEWAERFAVLAFAGLQLLIPQTDVYSLEPAADMTASSMVDNMSVGELIDQNGKVWSLFALSSDLSLLTVWPETYRIAILMKNVQPAFGLLCEHVDTVARSDISIHPIPAAMNCVDSPLLGIALYDNEVRYISSASALRCLFPY
jgi:hypothetical protein